MSDITIHNKCKPCKQLWMTLWSATKSIASWSLILISLASDMSSNVFYKSNSHFCRKKNVFSKVLEFCDCFCFDFEFQSVTRFLCENNWKRPTFENRILQNCHFFQIFFMDLKKLEQFWKLESPRIQNLCITWYFISSTSSTSSWKIWLFCE